MDASLGRGAEELSAALVGTGLLHLDAAQMREESSLAQVCVYLSQIPDVCERATRFADIIQAIGMSLNYLPWRQQLEPMTDQLTAGLHEVFASSDLGFEDKLQKAEHVHACLKCLNPDLFSLHRLRWASVQEDFLAHVREMSEGPWASLKPDQKGAAVYALIHRAWGILGLINAFGPGAIGVSKVFAKEGGEEGELDESFFAYMNSLDLPGREREIAGLYNAHYYMAGGFERVACIAREIFLSDPELMAETDPIKKWARYIHVWNRLFEGWFGGGGRFERSAVDDMSAEMDVAQSQVLTEIMRDFPGREGDEEVLVMELFRSQYPQYFTPEGSFREIRDSRDWPDGYCTAQSLWQRLLGFVVLANEGEEEGEPDEAVSAYMHSLEPSQRGREFSNLFQMSISNPERLRRLARIFADMLLSDPELVATVDPVAKWSRAWTLYYSLFNLLPSQHFEYVLSPERQRVAGKIFSEIVETLREQGDEEISITELFKARYSDYFGEDGDIQTDSSAVDSLWRRVSSIDS